MKTPAEVATTFLSSADEHGRRATVLRRLAGGIKPHVEGCLGLNPKEQKVLRDAMDLLDRMATVSAKAKTLTKRKADERERREKAIRAAMKDSFYAIDSIPGKIAFIGAVNSYRIKSENFASLNDLDFEFNEAIESLAYRLAGQEPESAPQAVVDKAWQKFVGARAGLEDKYQVIIGGLVVRESRRAEQSGSRT